MTHPMSQDENSTTSDPKRLLKGLNPKQAEAVSMPAQSCLIIAGAGSGKTKVLTSRVAWLIENGMARPDEILAVTFTNKAAREMVERLEKVGVATKGMWVGTFHGICNRFLRRFHKTANLPASFQILDVDDSKQLLKRVYKEREWSEESHPIKEAYYYIAAKKEEGLRPAQCKAKDKKEVFFIEAFHAYENQLQKEGAVDFPELMLRTVEILSANEDVRQWFENHFRQVLIDEFQDTNKLQYRWLRLITGMSNPVFAVGDGDQSVYGFRGAQVENINAFVKEFKLGDSQMVRLEQNYRSKGNILKAANALIKNNKARLDKNLWTDKDPGRALHVKECETDREEAQFVVEEAKRLREEGAPLDQIAMLYRTNSQSRTLEHELFKQGLPYRVHGGLRFFERAEIKHAMAYLRLAANKKDDSALLRVINYPARGIGAKTLEKFMKAALTANVSMWEAIAAGKDAEGAKTKEALEKFIGIIESIEQTSKEASLPKTMEAAIRASGLLALYEQDKDGQERVENLKELASAAQSFSEDPIASDRSLEAFLAHAALEAGEHGAKEGEPAVQLMTVHASKGLEFDHVMITGMEEGMFPHQNSMNDAKSIEEERRLMYVAITRARKDLTLSMAKERSMFGSVETKRRSRFLNELPRDCVTEFKSLSRDSEDEDQEVSWGHRSGARRYGDDRYGGSRREADEPYRGGGANEDAKRIAKTAENPNDPLGVGKTVRHPKFGAGVVKSRTGKGEDLTVEVMFKEAGLRRLVAKYAKLEPEPKSSSTPKP